MSFPGIQNCWLSDFRISLLKLFAVLNWDYILTLKRESRPAFSSVSWELFCVHLNPKISVLTCPNKQSLCHSNSAANVSIVIEMERCLATFLTWHFYESRVSPALSLTKAIVMLLTAIKCRCLDNMWTGSTLYYSQKNMVDKHFMVWCTQRIY